MKKKRANDKISFDDSDCILEFEIKDYKNMDSDLYITMTSKDKPVELFTVLNIYNIVDLKQFINEL